MQNADYEIKVDDWGPCFHTDEEGSKIQDWIDHLCPPRPVLTGFGGQMEDLAWKINIQYNGKVEFLADQWVGAGVIGILLKVDEDGVVIDKERQWRYSIFLQSDSFLAALTGCYACLRWKQAEINEGMHDENYYHWREQLVSPAR